MPNPNNYDNKNDFMDVCIPQVLDEGTARNQEQAVAICNSMWEGKSVRSQENEQEFIKQLIKEELDR